MPDVSGFEADLDRMAAERFSPVGETPAVVLDAAVAPPAWLADTQAVRIGVDRGGDLCVADLEAFDVLFTVSLGAPAPWVCVSPGQLDEILASLTARIAAKPIASSVLCKVLRIGRSLAWPDALALESLAYSTLLGGAEFRAWLAAQPGHAPPNLDGPRVSYAREGDCVTLTLANPAARNATDSAMRDALCEALSNVLEDPTEPSVILRGAGDCFSTGGHLGEFGRADDLALAHVVRSLRSPASLLHALGDRARVVLHGACIGGGLEIAAAAARRLAKPGAFFQLPEVSMGLIPGAGGTVSLARVIGRHRLAHMALSGRRIALRQALDWDLVEAAGEA